MISTKRTTPDLTGDADFQKLARTVRKRSAGRVVNIFGAPPIEGLGTAGGFKIVIQDVGDTGPMLLQKTAEKVVAAGEADPLLQGLFTSFRADTPWLELIVDRTQAKDRGVSIDDLRNDAGIDHWALLHQRFQSIRPHLAGQCAGQGHLPAVD